MGHSEGSTERKVHSHTDLPKEDRKINNLTLHLYELEEQQQSPESRRKEMICFHDCTY